MDITPEMARAELARRELVRRKSGIQNNKTSIPHDLLEGATNLVMSAGDKALQLPGEAQEAGEAFLEHPLQSSHRAAKNVLSGVTEGAKQLFNLPLNVAEYLGSKDIPYFKQIAPLAEKLKVGNTGIQEKFLGEPQKGDIFWQDVGQIAPMIAAPESLGVNIPKVTSKGLMKQLSKEKGKRLSIAKNEYKDLFNSAAEKGIETAPITKTISKNKSEIIKNSQPKHHNSFKEYLSNPSLENAHWAQSELGSLIRHFEKIDKRTGLTPSQIKTYKAAQEARNGIKKSMFSENSLAKNPEMALAYDRLGNKYKSDVIPYTSLEELSEFESGKIRPKKAVEELLRNEEFMINLANNYPGIYAHTPLAKKIGWGTAGLLGYDEIKKLLK